MPPADAHSGPGPGAASVRPGPTGSGETRFPAFPGFGAEDDDADSEDTLDLHLPAEFLALFRPKTPELLDGLPEWGPVTTPAGSFRLEPVSPERDLALIHGWMNDPAVAEFWDLAGPPELTERHLRTQLDGDGRSVPCLGLLDGTPMSYWEIYRADLDPLARHCPVRPHDTGIHLLIGAPEQRGRGLGSTLLAAVAVLVLARRPACARVLAEPDVRNAPSLAAFRKAGFRRTAEVDLPGKRAALMIRERAARAAA